MMNTTDDEHFIYAQYYNHLEKFGTGVHILHQQYGIKAKRFTSLSKSKPKEFLPKLSTWISLKTHHKKGLKECILEHKIDIIHVHFGTTAAEQWKELKLIKIPMVVSYYGWDYNKALSIMPEYQLAYKGIFEKAYTIIVEGPYGSEQLKSLGASEQKISILPLGIDTNKIVAAKRVHKSNGTLRLIQIASFTEKKGQLYSVKALHKAIINGLKVSLTLIGDERDPEYAQEVTTYIEDHDLQEYVNILNWITFEKIHNVLSNYDVFIHPSLYAKDGDCEGGSPVIILMAQACGLPIISTHHCDIPNQTVEGKTSLLVNEKNVDNTFLCIQKFYQMDERVYLSMSNHAIDWAQTFDVSLMGQRLTDIYSNIVE